MEEGVGFVDMWLNFVGRDYFFMSVCVYIYIYTFCLKINFYYIILYCYYIRHFLKMDAFITISLLLGTTSFKTVMLVLMHKFQGSDLKY